VSSLFLTGPMWVGWTRPKVLGWVKTLERIPLVGLVGELIEGYLPLVDDYFYCEFVSSGGWVYGAQKANDSRHSVVKGCFSSATVTVLMSDPDDGTTGQIITKAQGRAELVHIPGRVTLRCIYTTGWLCHLPRLLLLHESLLQPSGASSAISASMYQETFRLTLESSSLRPQPVSPRRSQTESIRMLTSALSLVLGQAGVRSVV
jgi:hypothetical protein